MNTESVNIKRLYTSVVLLFCISVVTNAQVNYGGVPHFPQANFLRISGESAFFRMPSFDIDSLLAEDAEDESGMRGSYRFAHKFYTDINMKRDAYQSILPDGTNVWTLTIQSDGAYSLNFLLEDVFLPDGAQLFFYNPDHSHIIGKFDKRNVSASGILPTRPVEGETVIVEYSEPMNVEFSGNFRITEVNHDYRDFLRREPYPDPTKSACMKDVLCEEDVPQELVRATVQIIINGRSACTGTLINNTEKDGTPYLLTAVHCLNDTIATSQGTDYYEWKAGTIVTFFNYDRTACGTSMKATEEMSIAGAYPRVVIEKRDVALLELQETPPDYYNVYYAGWNLSSALNNSPYHSLHHPQGGLKKYGRYDGSLSLHTLTAEGYTFASNSHLRVRGWTVGSTAGGSSGSPLFGKDSLIVGALTGGASLCTGVNPNGDSDYYYSFAKAWDATNTMGQLKTFLNPNNAPVTYCSGYDPHASNPIMRLSNIDYTAETINNSDVLEEPNSGYVFGGNNSLGATEFAEAFYTEDELSLMGAYFLIPPMSYNSANGVEVSVYKGVNSPEECIGTYHVNPRYTKYSSSQGFQETNKTIASYGTENFVLFAGELKVKGNFYVSYKSSDLFRVYNAESDGDRTNTAWIRNSAGNWVEAEDYSPYGKATSLSILALVSSPNNASIDQPESEKTKSPLYYSSSESTFNMNTVNFESGSLKIYSVTGQLIEEIELLPTLYQYPVRRMSRGTIGIAKVQLDDVYYSVKFIY